MKMQTDSWNSSIYILQSRLWNKDYNTKDQRRHYIMIKGSIQEEDITVEINVNTPNIGAPTY